jgi:cytochrome c-type biogenesis protein CcsB
MNSIQLATFSNHAIYACLAIFAVAFVSHTIEVAWSVRNIESGTEGSSKTEFAFSRTERAGRIGNSTMILGTLVLLVAVTTRGLSAGRVPWGNMYEFSITGALALSVAYLFALKKYKVRWLGLPVSLATLLTLGTAITVLYRPSEQLVPALKSPWLALHVSAAIISGGVFLVANLVAATFLWMEKIEKKGPRPLWAKKIPSLEALDQLSYRLIAFVFPLWTFAIVAGAIWAESAWGHYWSWDPKETWAFITWVAYAAYLHARVTVGWRGRRAAWLCIFAGSTFLFNYIWVNIWGTGLHTYSGL